MEELEKERHGDEEILPTPLLPLEELEERHGDEENIDGWLNSFFCICI